MRVFIDLSCASMPLVPSPVRLGCLLHTVPASTYTAPQASFSCSDWPSFSPLFSLGCLHATRTFFWCGRLRWVHARKRKERLRRRSKRCSTRPSFLREQSTSLLCWEGVYVQSSQDEQQKTPRATFTEQLRAREPAAASTDNAAEHSMTKRREQDTVRKEVKPSCESFPRGHAFLECCGGNSSSRSCV